MIFKKFENKGSFFFFYLMLNKTFINLNAEYDLIVLSIKLFIFLILYFY